METRHLNKTNKTP